MIFCTIADELAHFHIAELEECPADETFSARLLKRAAIDSALEAVLEHRSSCLVCRGKAWEGSTVH